MSDRGYDAESIRQGLRDRGIIPFLAKRNTEHGSGLGRWRWVVEAEKRLTKLLRQFGQKDDPKSADRITVQGAIGLSLTSKRPTC